MSPWFEWVSILTSITGGLLSLFITLISSYIAHKTQRKKLLTTQQQRLQTVLESNDLSIVGKYLDDVIGKFNISEYVSNVNVSVVVDKYLERFRYFIGTDTEVERQTEVIEAPIRVRIPIKLPDEFGKALDEIRLGEVWNALARLRRHIEITLREITEIKNIGLDRPSSAGYLLELLYRNELLSKDNYLKLKFAIALCNKAIHGFDVTTKEAEKAVLSAYAGLRLSNKPH